jgi:hypothetical protein
VERDFTQRRKISVEGMDSLEVQQHVWLPLKMIVFFVASRFGEPEAQPTYGKSLVPRRKDSVFTVEKNSDRSRVPDGSSFFAK